MGKKNKFTLTGNNLDIDTLVDLANSAHCEVNLSPDGLDDMVRAREIVDQKISSEQPIYGLTTGLGSRVSEQLSQEQLVEFSYQTLRGRGHSLGTPLNRNMVRAAMIVRLNTLLSGAPGTSLQVALFIRECLNNNLIPLINNIGSIGASDLCWGATMGLAFIGEGKMITESGSIMDSKTALKKAGMKPLVLGPKDGLALANHASFSAALSATALQHATLLIRLIQCTAAVSMEAFRANLSPLNTIELGSTVQPGCAQAAGQLSSLLEGSVLFEENQWRKIQDPLSFRNIVQVHGAALSALEFARDTVNLELNACTDNPVVDLENHNIISSGGYYSAHITLVLETVCRALDQVVVTQLARMTKLLSNRHSELPQYLAVPGADSNGFAPTLKLAEALVAEIKQLFTPVMLWPSINADGVEDIQNHAPLRAKSLDQAIELATKLCAMELVISCQGLELRGDIDKAPAGVLNIYQGVRSVVATFEQDRPLGEDIENLAEYLGSDKFPIQNLSA